VEQIKDKLGLKTRMTNSREVRRRPLLNNNKLKRIVKKRRVKRNWKKFRCLSVHNSSNRISHKPHQLVEVAKKLRK
jgi:hypothetical protein